MSISFDIAEFHEKIEKRVFTVFDCMSQIGGLWPFFIIFGQLLLFWRQSNQEATINEKLVMSMHVTQGKDEKGATEVFSKRKMTSKDFNQKLLTKGAKRVKQNLNIHYLSNRLSKLECLLSVLVKTCLEKYPDSYDDVFVEYSMLFLHQSTLLDEDNMDQKLIYKEEKR